MDRPSAQGRSGGGRRGAPARTSGRGPGRHHGQLPGERPGVRRPGVASRSKRRRCSFAASRLAREVRDELAVDGIDRWVAASIGPYGAVLADGSEYRGRYGVTAARLRDFHGPRLELLASAGPDLIAVETIPDIDEAEVLVDLLYDVDLPTWFSFSAREGRTAAGQPLTDAFDTAAAPTTVVAVGVNCCPADEVLDAVRLAVEVGRKKAVAYPNGGGEWDAERGPGSVSPTSTPTWRGPGWRPGRPTSAAAAGSARTRSLASRPRSPVRRPGCRARAR